MSSRHVPVAVRRKLREEANYGCAYCGAPLVQYHHIVPFHEEEHHDPERMIALCPTCHAEADAGTIKRDKLYELKESPAISEKVEHEFYFESKERMITLGNVGAMIKEDQEGRSPVLQVDGENLIEVGYSDGILEFDINFYSDGDLIATITSGEWWVDVENIWDFEYKKKTMKILCNEKDLGLAIEYDPDSDEVSVVGKLEYGGNTVLIRQDSERGIFIPEMQSGFGKFTVALNDGEGAAFSL